MLGRRSHKEKPGKQAETLSLKDEYILLFSSISYMPRDAVRVLTVPTLSPLKKISKL